MTEWDTAGQGVHVVIGAEDTEDIIPTNRWLKRADMPGRIAEMMKPLGLGRGPMPGHKTARAEPLRFTNQGRFRHSHTRHPGGHAMGVPPDRSI